MRINSILPMFMLLVTPVAVVAQSSQVPVYGNAEFKDRMLRLRPNDIVEFNIFYKSVLIAFRNRDNKAIASLIRYPIKIEIGKKTISVKSQKEFSHIAKKALCENFIKLILCESQNLHCMPKGIMLGDGELWFNTDIKNGDWKIIAINN